MLIFSFLECTHDPPELVIKIGLRIRNTLINKIIKTLNPIIRDFVSQKVKYHPSERDEARNKHDIIEEVSSNASAEVMETLQDFFSTILESKDYTDQQAHELISDNLKKIQSIYAKDLQDIFFFFLYGDVLPSKDLMWIF